MKKGQKEQNNFPYPVSGIFQDLEDLDPHIKKSLPLEIFNFINQNRLSATKVREEFLKYCVHKNQEVTIKDSKASFTGEFIGITKEGAAILKDSNDKQHEVLSGSLFL
jgi:biotin-(acetyl-CoA carboxylase) ligase